MLQKHQLKNFLSVLRLKGLEDNLDIRVKEAMDNQLGYLDFLSLLLQDETEYREQSGFRKRIKASGLGNVKTFEDFDFKFNEPDIPAATVRELATCRFLERKENVIIAGPPGIGKTHIAKALAHEACRRKCSSFFSRTVSLLKNLLNEVNPRKYKLRWRQCINVDVLIFDDFAFRKMDIREAELFYEIVDERLGKPGVLIVTSNRPPEDWGGVFPDQIIGGAILDRVVSGSHRIIAARAKSYRKEGKKDY